ncbi:permease-like cell division protein FtsX [Cytobacillus sp. IB215665]|uniref:permease-like cell division protein FtsX n=1 Tax=Cytobacillus sp. IB215665 TaxID=3097357 RepID=UPI002A0E67FC|nr:permease-like cell division protein FtsX [Cytobacillus sp. IB215665]MDX8363838.1 permease-like cell division protein FtsX [Cytobacillus sp. IB215665]
MKFSTLKRHTRESVKNLGRNGWMTFASISAVTVTLLLVGVFLVIMMNMYHFTQLIEEDVEIRVFIDTVATGDEVKELEKNIDKIAEVKSITFVSKDEELDSLVESLGPVLDMLKGDNNPLSDVYVVKTNQPIEVNEVAKKIEDFSAVAQVDYGEEVVDNLFKIFNVSRNIGFGLVIGLLFTAMFLISNTIKITIVARRSEIEIMKLVGATNSFIRWPFFLEGLWLGVLGAILPISIILTAYYYLHENAQPMLSADFLQMLPFYPFALQIALILILIGACIGVWGSLMSVRKFLKV